MKRPLLCVPLFIAVLAIGLAAPADACSQPNNSEKPGSVLVFPKFIRGTINDIGFSGQAVHAITELEISVMCPVGETCALNQAVRMRAHWVCPGDEVSEQVVCSETSFNLQTTVGGTLYFNPEGVTVLGGVVTAQVYPNNATTTILTPPCQRGYLIVWVIDGGGNAIKFDGLIGNAVIKEPTPTCGGPCSARAYNAIPIQAASGLSTGDLTNVDGDPAGDLDFDGTEYQMVTGRIFGTVRYANLATPDRVETHLTLLTLDVASNRHNPPTDVGFNFYSPDEQFVDAGTSFVCWTEQSLTQINAGLTKQAMGRKGFVESTYAEQNGVPVTLLGLVETLETNIFGGNVFSRDFSYSLFNDGNAVATTFRP